MPPDEKIAQYSCIGHRLFSGANTHPHAWFPFGAFAAVAVLSGKFVLCIANGALPLACVMSQGTPPAWAQHAK